MTVTAKAVLTRFPRETPMKAYRRAMDGKMFHLAATIAKSHGLGRGLVIDAAFRAFCRYDDLGMDEAAGTVLSQFGFIPREGDSELIRAVQAHCQLEADIPTAVIMQGPTDIQ